MNKYESLKDLKKLFDEGLISQDEFVNEKQKILNYSPTKISSFFSKKKLPAVFKSMSQSTKKIAAFSLAGILALVVIAFISTNGFKKGGFNSIQKGPQPSVKVYLDAEEVFPVHLFYLKNTKQGFMELTITNPSTITKDLEVSYGFTEFGEMESHTLIVKGGSVTELQITPFSTKLLEVVTPVNATLMVKVVDEQKKAIFSKSWSLKVNNADEIPWEIKNQDCTKLIASWITPRDESVKKLIDKSTVERNRSTVANMNDVEFRDLVEEIFNIVRDEGIIYTDSTISFGVDYKQRVRLPSLTLETKSANSLDGSVLLASLFENVGLRPYIVILPGHVIVAVSRPNSKSGTLFIESTLLGRSMFESFISFESTFSSATKMGREEYSIAYSKSVNNESGLFSIIDVQKARQEGVLPIK